MTTYRGINNRLRVAFILFLALFGYLAYHLYGVQIERHAELHSKAKAKYTKSTSDEGVRGEIFDYDGNVLVGNHPVGNIVGDPSLLKNDTKCREAAAFIAEELDLPYPIVYRKLARKTFRQKQKDGTYKLAERRYVVLKKNIPFEEYEKILKKISEKKLKGLTGHITLRRTYPKNRMLANILGYTEISNDRLVPRSGLEKTFDEDIASKTGTIVYERSRDGTPLAFGEISRENAEDGYNLYLTIREPIQAILEEEIDKMMAKTGAKRGYAVMADPYTGDIIGVAQRPTFNPNDRSTMKQQLIGNPIIEMVFEPGSIMKPIPVAGALDQGIVRPDTRFDCEMGTWFYAGKRLKDSHKLDTITVSEIIQHSSNIGTAKIALEIGEPRLKNILSSFGFGQRTGVPLRPESRGIFYRYVSKISITRIPIGQGIAVTPLQIVRAYCALANGGYPVKLRFVDRIVHPETGKIQKIPVDKGTKIFKRPETKSEIIAMMKRVTQPGGTATEAAIPGYYVAGKTGTAEKSLNGKAYSKIYTASFAGFVPADNPRFVLLVTCDEPSRGDGPGFYYGGKAAAPYFKSIAERTLKYMHVPPDMTPEEYEAMKKAAAQKAREDKQKLWAREREMRNKRKASTQQQKTKQTTLVVRHKNNRKRN
ncbi:MAG: penicillin-binding protein 2 [Lentisphaeria bacterium]|nr:penicillin-binding protein 2 [Lentisphaeria bacterium]